MEEQSAFATCHQLAKLVEKALIDEVELSPKPGLVDRLTTGSHSDMNHELFVLSARTLTPFFEEMALASWQKRPSQAVREAIAEIGRRAETAMFAATGGVNTHKGAIWAMGLFISVISRQYSCDRQLFLPKIFTDIQQLVAYPDRRIQVAATGSHGNKVKQKYGYTGAFGEAAAGFPHVQVALSDFLSRQTNDSSEKRLHMLLAIMATLDDTCILYRSDQQVLNHVQQLAKQANKQPIPNAAFEALNNYCQQQNVSPGGSADLLAASFFLISLENLTSQKLYFATAK
jgi:triphosphoribosyl-dephospho-CoA synthase